MSSQPPDGTPDPPLDTSVSLRRTQWRRLALVAVACLVVATLTAGIVVGAILAGRRSAPAGGSPSGPPPRAVDALGGRPEATDVPLAVPDRAFLTADDLTLAGKPAQVPSDGTLLRPCGALYPSEDLVGPRRSMRFEFLDQPVPDGTTATGTGTHTVTVYRGDGALRYLDELAEAVRRCPDEAGPDAVSYRLVDPPALGDGAVLVGIPWGHAGPDYPAWYCAVRVGNAVAVLSFNAGAVPLPPELAHQLAELVAERLAAWRR